MNCQQAERLMEDAIDRRLSGGMKRRFDLHVARCAACHSRLAAEQREHARWFHALNDCPLAQAVLPADFASRLAKAVDARPARRSVLGRLPRWVQIAAVLAVMAAFSAFGAWVVKGLADSAAEAGRAEGACAVGRVDGTGDGVSIHAETFGNTNEGEESTMNVMKQATVCAAMATAAVTSPMSVLASGLPLDENGQWKEEVLYVETDGSKTYFDTGVKVGPNTHVVTCVAFVSWPKYGTSVGAGMTPNGATIAFSPSGSDNGDVWRTTVGGQWNDPGWQNSSYKADTNFHVWNLKSGSQRIDGLLIAASEIPADVPALCNFMLGARQVAFNGATTPEVNSFTEMRIRSCKIYDGTTLLKDYVAAYQNGVYGLVDQKDGSFHTASGGSFTGKRQKAAIPVDYVESKSGSEISVDTGIRPTETTRVVADVAFKLTDGTLMGSGGGSAAPNVVSILFGTSWGNTFQWYVGDAYSSSTTVKDCKEDQDRHTWDLSSGSQKIDDVEYATATIPSGSTPGPNFILFARRLSEKDAVDSWHPAQIYGCKMYDGEALLRDFKPCFLNGRYCLWDEVTGKAFYGDGKAIEDSSYGVADLGGASLDIEYERFSFLKSTGTQYIDTRVKVQKNTRVWARMSFAGFTDSQQCMGFATTCDNKHRISMLLGLKMASDGKFGGWFGPNYDALLTYERVGDTAVHEWDFQNGSQKIDGNVASDQTYGGDNGWSNTAPNDTFFLFARNKHWGNQELAVDWFSKVKMYGFKIWNGDKLVRDYVAAEVGGRACLYDRVSGLPFFSPVGDEFRAKNDGLIITVR